MKEYYCFQMTDGALFWVEYLSESWQRADFMKWVRLPEFDLRKAVSHENH